MKSFRLILIVIAAAILAGCGDSGTNQGDQTNHARPRGVTSVVDTPGPSPEPPALTVSERPQKIKDMMAARGEQDTASPILKIIEPKANASLETSTVKVKLELSGDLKGYKPGMNEETHTGNHIHVILDNQPYEAYYDLDQPFELRNVMDGEHILRVFPSRPWHESYKNAGAFQRVKFTVKNGGANASEPATTGNGQKMADANATPAGEGKEVKPSNSGPIDLSKPLLTYSRPKGEYKDADADAIMIDFWLANAKLKDSGGDFRVRYSVDGGEAKFLDKWEPIWLTGWTAGKHNVVVELVDKNGNPVVNGGYNATTREITISK